MNKKNTLYILTLFALFSLHGIFAQDFTLKITSINTIEKTLLEKIDYKKEHKTTKALDLEINRISEYLKTTGYFINTVDSINSIEKKYTAYFNLNKETNNVIIKLDSNSKIYFKKNLIKDKTIKIPIEKLSKTLSEISKKLDNEGKSFSKIQLQNIKIKEDNLFAELKINQSKKRVINKVKIKGYENFPKSYLKNYFNIKPNTLFNQQKIKEISTASQGISFVTEIKPPEVLFTKDSTLLYMYLKKRQNNSFDGIVSFTSKENGNVLFNGNLDIKLNNILNSGENFELFWNSIGEERQELELSTEIPYIFNSKFSPEVSFLIYKQDSSFINSKFDSRLSYNINSKTKIALTYNSETSENLIKNLNNNIENFDNYFLGMELKHRIPKNDVFFTNKFFLEINPSFGRRKVSGNSSNQFKFESTISYLWDLNLRNSIYIRNKIGYLNSDTYFNNELLRIGGANSIRGFNEQSIFTKNFNYFNIEYRYLTSEKSYLYTITDIGRIDLNSQKETLLGFGLGYLFNTNNSQINLSLSAGKINKQNIDFKRIKLIINWKNYF
ncbi:ShlB/FhaC/HecB family hemolysin secretion/activation protein [Polaribacter staleyi]|uniref:ShlB/FhaC/HecB family hemolysin secretion/activation protein n=1 Tax=Polaribacter staleyi TaxID=2022337 RepID=UPI0031BB0B2E